MSPSLAN